MFNQFVHNTPSVNTTLRNALVTYLNEVKAHKNNVLPNVPFDATEKAAIEKKLQDEINTATVELEKVNSVLKEKRTDVATVKTEKSTYKLL